MAYIGMHAALYRGVCIPGMEWVRRDIHDPAQRSTVRFQGRDLPILEVGYWPGGRIPVFAVTAGDWSDDKERPGLIYKLSLVVQFPPAVKIE